MLIFFYGSKNFNFFYVSKISIFFMDQKFCKFRYYSKNFFFFSNDKKIFSKVFFFLIFQTSKMKRNFSSFSSEFSEDLFNLFFEDKFILDNYCNSLESKNKKFKENEDLCFDEFLNGFDLFSELEEREFSKENDFLLCLEDEILEKSKNSINTNDFSVKRIENFTDTKQFLKDELLDDFKPNLSNTIDNLRITESKARKQEIKEEDIIYVGNQVKLFKHQQRVLNVIEENKIIFKDTEIKGSIIAMYMGYGKTLTSLAYIEKCKDYESKYNLVVCSKKNISTWTDEIKKFYKGKLNVYIYHKSKHSFFFNFNFEEFKENKKPFIIITTFECLRANKTEFVDIEKRSETTQRKIQKANKFLYQTNWDTVVIDESTKITSIKNQITKCCHDLNAKYKLILTGTVVSNHSSEVWSLLYVLGLNVEHYHKNYNSFIENNFDKLIYIPNETDVQFDLPQLEEKYVSIEPDDNLRTVYNALRNLFIQYNNEEKIKKKQDKKEGKFVNNGSKNIGLLTLLRQCCNSPHHLDINKIKKHFKNVEENKKLFDAINHKILSPKLKKTFEIINQHFLNGQKILIFSYFKKTLEDVQLFCKKISIPCFSFNNKDNTNLKENIVKDFNRFKGGCVMTLNIMSASEGLNLQDADAVVLVEPSFNATRELQAIARAHRIGSKTKKKVYHLFIKDSFEMYIINIQYNKEIETKKITKKKERNYEGFDNITLKYSIKNSKNI